MPHRSTFFRSLAVVAVAMGLLGMGLSGCAGGSPEGSDGARDMQMVTVNWIEGMAMTYLQEQILEDSLDMNVEVNEVQGGGIAFSSVAKGDADFFNEAWLPTTHREPWSTRKDSLQKLGYTYKGTTVGIAVPTYMEVDTVPDFSRYRQGLNGTIHGIESGAAINDQIRNTLELYALDDEFSVTPASGPANWQALASAIAQNEPIAVAAWYPHWKWTEYDIKYVDGARTGHNVDIWGQPEDIFTIVDNQFVDQFPKTVVCFLKAFEASDEQVMSLMSTFKNRGEASKREAARQWIKNHPEDVSRWLQQAEECAASGEPVTPLPDDATFSSDPDGDA